MRRRTITLVIVGLVLALFVLPAAANEILGDDPEATVAEEDVAPVSFGYDEVNHVVFYNVSDGEDPPVDCTEEAVAVIDSEGDITGAPEGCDALLIEGPNGQVNHGQFVSSMVHLFKDGYEKSEHGPFGQFLKDIKHDKEIGKGLLQVKPDKDGDLDPLEAAELDDEGDEGEKDKSDKSNKRSDKSKGKNG